jgi:2-polyprenyl-3-methyl-5-hydroxy-6-metoxy-1,4-benzoquinol methylase
VPPDGSVIPRGSKPDEYYGNARGDLVEALPRPLGRVLDVGAGAGGVGRGLRAAGAEWLSGVEIDPAAAARAEEVYDELIVAPVEEAIDQLTGPFDRICCYDVLEHLVDPDSVLERLHGIAADGALIHVSVPNARQITLVYDLVVRGTFGYTEWGHRDSTHLRWFTRRDIEALLGQTGWRVESVSHPALDKTRHLARMTRGKSTEFAVGQWYLLARKA